MKHSAKPKNVCPSQIDFDLDGNKVTNIKFHGGCPGNLLSISTLLEGQTVEYICDKLQGIKCGQRSTSCSDQLCTALLNAQAQESNS
ncbi:MAG: TIGR03905 family TSCPD domain-containing protein [Anaerovoracaceae bacterium]